MERRQVLLVDAFADEPMGGQQIPVLPSGEQLSETQLRRVADEFGTPGAVARQESELVSVDRDGCDAGIGAIIAGAASLFERGQLEAGPQSVRAGQESRSVEIDADGRAWTETGPQDIQTADVTERDIADALGTDVAAIRDVGADLPIARTSAGEGSLLVAVNFFEHLSGADPDRLALADLLAAADVTRLLAFTFDTLTAGGNVHARVFEKEASAGVREQATSGVAAAALGGHLSQQHVLDETLSEVRIECGHLLDRPATMRATLENAPSVGGVAVTTVDGEMTIPDEGDDDIIEV